MAPSFCPVCASRSAKPLADRSLQDSRDARTPSVTTSVLARILFTYRSGVKGESRAD